MDKDSRALKTMEIESKNRHCKRSILSKSGGVWYCRLFGNAGIAVICCPLPDGWPPWVDFIYRDWGENLQKW